MDYFLKSERLGFRLLAPSDADLTWRLFGDPAVSKYIGGPLAREAVDRALASHIAMQRKTGLQYWPFFLLATGEFAGCCGARPRPEPGACEIGFYVLPALQGRGYATEAARAVVSYVRGALRIPEIYASHHPENGASRSVLGKLGFRYERDEPYPLTGRPHPLYRLPRP